MDIQELESTFSKYNISAKGKAIFEKLYTINTRLLETIDFEILSDKFISTLSF